MTDYKQGLRDGAKMGINAMQHAVCIIDDAQQALAKRLAGGRDYQDELHGVLQDMMTALDQRKLAKMARAAGYDVDMYLAVYRRAQALLKDIGERMPCPLVKIEISGGCLTAVTGLLPGQEYELIDHDNTEYLPEKRS